MHLTSADIWCATWAPTSWSSSPGIVWPTRDLCSSCWFVFLPEHVASVFSLSWTQSHCRDTPWDVQRWTGHLWNSRSPQEKTGSWTATPEEQQSTTNKSLIRRLNTLILSNLVYYLLLITIHPLPFVLPSTWLAHERSWSSPSRGWPSLFPEARRNKPASWASTPGPAATGTDCPENWPHDTRPHRAASSESPPFLHFDLLHSGRTGRWDVG